MISAACSAGTASLGEPCDGHGDCRAQLQCLGGVCTPLCAVHAECGDGFVCTASGACEQVLSAIGDPCSREIDCGPGQACRLDPVDRTGDGFLDGTCQPEHPGAVTGAACADDGDCRNGACSIGRCTPMCLIDTDCAPPLSCVTMPRLLIDSAPPFRGCLQSTGTISLDIPMSAPYAELRVPVPENARSFALIARIDDQVQLVGAAKVTSPPPRRDVLYVTPNSPAEYYANPLRYEPSRAISTLLMPNAQRLMPGPSDDEAVTIEHGVYTVEVGSFAVAGAVGTAIPKVTVHYKLDTAARLDLHFHFLDLGDHPCAAAFGAPTLNAAGAQQSDSFQDEFLGGPDGLAAIFAQAGITLGTVTYSDVTDRPDLDGLRAGDLPRLLRLSRTDGGINVFFVRSISPVGIQALPGGAPGPTGRAGTAASGIAVSVDTLCYRGWDRLARVTAHELGRYMGLFRNREPDGHTDPIEDTAGEQNLMFFSEEGGTELSPGQSQVLRLFPGLQ